MNIVNIIAVKKYYQYNLYRKIPSSTTIQRFLKLNNKKS